MKPNMTKRLAVTVSQCDSNGIMRMDSVFNAFLDMASEHAQELGMGSSSMKAKVLYWVVAKTKVHVEEFPNLGEAVDLETWPKKADRIRCDRCYEMTKAGKLLASGRTQWAVLEADTGKLHSVENVYPEDLVCLDKEPLLDPFDRISEKQFEESFSVYRVCSTDIDLAHHMNNCAYVRAVLSLFSTEELNAMKIRDMEILYKASALEGDDLRIYKKEDDRVLDLKGELPDGRTCFLVRMLKDRA